MNRPWQALPPRLSILMEEIASRFERRRRLRWLARAGAWLAALALGATAARWLELPGSLVGAGVLTGAVVFAGLIARALRPQPVPLDRLAMYLDDRHPELENRFLSAVDIALKGGDAQASYLVQEFYREVEALVPGLELEDLFDGASLQRLARRTAAVWAVALLGLLVAPSIGWPPSMRTAHRAASEEHGQPAATTFEVQPGDARVRRGSNLVVMVTSNAASRDRSIRWRAGDADAWVEAPLQPTSSDDVQVFQYLNLQEDMQYQVRVGERVSPLFRVAVWTPPEVLGIDLTYHYPPYLELPEKHVPRGGDIAAVEGTQVELDVEVNKPIERAAIVLDDGRRIDLTETSATLWTGRLPVERDGRYRIELQDRDGMGADTPTEYRISALPDQPPRIRIAYPRGDDETTPIDEVPVEFAVSDDFGLADYGIEYQIGGGEPVRVSLRTPDADPLQARVRHWLMLERLGLTPGDLITWTVYAEDRKPDRPPFETLGDPFFLEIRPFRRQYAQAVSNQGAQEALDQQQGGQQGEGGMGGSGDPSADQKQIIIATWNLRRESAGMPPEEFERRRDVIRGAQQSLLETVRGGGTGDPLAGMMRGGRRGGAAADPAEAMERAVDALVAAEPPTPEQQLSQALVHEQEAYRRLLRGQPDQAQVMQARGNRRGGAQQRRTASANRELDQLQLEQRRNFFDEASTLRDRAEQTRQQSQTLDELRDLARRQQMLNEDMARLLSELQTAPEAQREELRRRLERLREEQQRAMQQLDQLAGQLAANEADRRQTQQQLQEARREMNRSLQNLQEDQLQQARSAGSRAAQSLDQAEQTYRQLTAEGARQQFGQLREQMNELQRQQDAIMAGARGLRDRLDRPGLERADRTREQVQQLLEQKEQLARAWQELLDRAAQLAADAAQQQELAARRLGDWVRQAAREGVPEAIEQARPLLEYGVWDAALAQEETVRQQLERAAAGLNEIERSMVADDLEALQRAVESLRAALEGDTSRTLAASQPRRGGRGERGSADDAASSGSRRGAGTEAARGARRSGERGETGAGGRDGERGEAGARGPGGSRGESGTTPGERGQPGTQGGRGQTVGEGERGQPGDGNAQGQNARGQRGDRGEAGAAGERGSGRGGSRAGEPATGTSVGEREGRGARSGRGARDGALGERGAPGERGESLAAGGLRRGGAWGGAWDDRALTPWSGGLYDDRGVVRWGPRDETELRRFLEEDYRRWAEALREAEALLPEDNPNRGRIAEVRDQIDTLRRRFLRDRVAPQFDFFVDQVTAPLVRSVWELEQEIARRLSDNEFAVSGEDKVPAQYADRVAEYFKALTELEQAR